MIGETAIGAAVGLCMDRVFGEPPDHLHPVVGIGRGLARLERSLYADNRPAGVLYAAIGAGVGVLSGLTLTAVAGPTVATALSVGSAGAGRMLGESATSVGEHLQAGDIDEARVAVRSLVGRDPERLAEPEITRAVIESVAENTVDAVTATLFWAVVAGPAGVWAHRVVNTMDAMVGHRNDRYRSFGWAAARLDDAMNWIPARLTALAVAAAMPSRAVAVVRITMRDGSKHPSPNGGVIEAAFAAALDVTLGGSNNYGGVQEVRGPLGDGRRPAPADIARSVELANRCSGLTLAGLTILWLWPAWVRGR